MKTRVFFTIAFILTLACLSMPAIDLNGIFAQYPQEQKVQEKFEHYRQAIKDAFHVDIKDFRDGLNGGLADAKLLLNMI
jgi:Skp family chaperone for outer membrane proteins